MLIKIHTQRNVVIIERQTGLTQYFSLGECSVIELTHFKQFRKKPRCQRHQHLPQEENFGASQIILPYFLAFPKSIKMIKE